MQDYTKGLISIIVPIYNTEQYLKRCVNTIINQTYKNIEILLINDGSTDSSGQICDEYKAKNPEIIKVIHQKNKGVSAARNVGLKLAKGEYIGFVDSDDWIAPNMYEALYSAASKENLEVVICDWFEVDKNLLISQKAYYKGHDTLRSILKQDSPTFLWNKLYHATLRNRLFYPDDITLVEDAAILLPLLSYVKSFKYVDLPLYYCLKHDDSESKNPKSQIVLSYLEAGKRAIENCNVKYEDEIAYTIAMRLYNARTWTFKYYIPQSIEYVNSNLIDYFKNNDYVLKDTKINKILSYPGTELIPANLYYCNFGSRKLEEHEKVCVESWYEFAHNFNIVELNEKNCDINNAPKIIQNAYKSKNYELVSAYFRAKNIYENGGIAVEPYIKFNLPIDSLRLEKSFFSFKNREDLSPGIFGSVAKADVFKQILEGFDTDEEFELSSLIKDILIYSYFLTPRGWNQLLADGVSVFRADKLYYNMGSESYAQIYNKYNHLLRNEDVQVVDNSILAYWNDDKDNFWKDRESLKKELEALKKKLGGAANVDEIKKLKNEIAWLKNEVTRVKSSASWRITRPLRKFMNLFRRKSKKYTKEQVR